MKEAKGGKKGKKEGKERGYGRVGMKETLTIGADTRERKKKIKKQKINRR